jgi:hypothetical protein
MELESKNIIKNTDESSALARSACTTGYAATKYYLNLTNGIEYILLHKQNNYSFIRIQSTACEQKRWEYILQELDYTFLMDLAVGNRCVVIDYSARKEVPRSIYQGLEWIKFVLSRVWFGADYTPLVRGNNCFVYFDEQYKAIRQTNTINKLKYFRKFLLCNKITIDVISQKTDLDGDYLAYKTILEKYVG